MIINSHNEWDKLNDVIVGKGWMLKTSILETSFKLFYRSNLQTNGYEDNLKEFVNKQYIEEHCEDIEGLVTILKNLNINVYRPESIKKLTSIKTPNWSAQTHLTGPINTRDLVAIIGDTIMEFPPEIRSRYFEVDYMKHIFMDALNDNCKWLSFPKPIMTNESYNNNFLEPMLDAARCMRFGQDIIVNVNYKFNEVAVKLLKLYFPEYNFHMITYVNGHIDSCMAPLRPGLMLINKVFIPNPREQLPKFCRNWDFIEVEYHEEYDATSYAENDILLASTNIDCNILSIDPNTIICHDYSYSYLQPKLEPYGIEVIPCKLRHSRIFDGAFHCLTLDLNRSSVLESYE